MTKIEQLKGRIERDGVAPFENVSCRVYSFWQCLDALDFKVELIERATYMYRSANGEVCRIENYVKRADEDTLYKISYDVIDNKLSWEAAGNG